MAASPWVDEPRWKDDGNVLATRVAVPALSPVNAAGRGRYVEIEIHGRDAHSRIDRIGQAPPALLAQLPELTVEAARLAPAHWRSDHHEKALWLMAIEFHPGGAVQLLYDFGALDLVVLTIAVDGARSVTIEP